MKTAVLTISESGPLTAANLAGNLDNCEIFDLRGKGRLRNWVEENFHKYEAHIFIMSLGIVYRLIAPLITDKYRDPAVVVVDDATRHAIAALSGHEGGANRLSFKVARILDASPVVTTASDTNKRIIMGIGCRRGTTEEQITDAVDQALKENGLTPQMIRLALSVDIKKGEKGLSKAFDRMDIPLLFISSKRIREFTGYKNISQAALRQLDLPGVSEPCALLGGRDAVLIAERKIYGPVTIALAEEDRI